MTKKFIGLLMAASAMTVAALFGQEATPGAGGRTLLLGKRSYTLKHALAYEFKIDDEEGIAVVLSGQAVSGEMLTEVRAAEKEGGEGDLKRPFLKLFFRKTCELKYWSAGAGTTSLGRRSSSGPGELRLEKGRVSGKASQPLETEGMFPAGFDAHFDVALLKASESFPATKKPGPAANGQPTVAGAFKGNGKEAKLAFVSARWGEPFGGKPGIVLVFTEKDHSKDGKPDFNAAFGKFGSALIISLHDDGKIYGCQVVHSAHQKQGFSSIGSIETTDFTYEDGKVEGELTTNGQVDTFGETWEVNLKFLAPLGEIPKELQPLESAKPEKEEKAASTKSNDDDDNELTTQPAVDGPDEGGDQAGGDRAER